MKTFDLDDEIIIDGNVYYVKDKLIYGRGLLSRCFRYTFVPNKEDLPYYTAMQWENGEIYRYTVMKTPIHHKKSCPRYQPNSWNIFTSSGKNLH